MTVPPLSDEWCADHFDHQSPELAANLHETLARMRVRCPVTHSDQHDGFWVVTRFDDVLRVVQDWATFSSAHGVSPGKSTMTVRAIPEHVDPPLHRAYKRLINAWFTAAAVAPYEARTREIVTDLIDAFVDDGGCEFMSAFARPVPGLTFFELALGAPPEEVAEVNAYATTATNPTNPGSKEAWQAMFGWITSFVERRRRAPRRHDVVDAILHADIEGRPITEAEVVGMIQLLILGGLDTTAGVLGQAMIRLCGQPDLLARLQAEPQCLPAAVEEFLRLDGSFVAIGRTAMQDVQVGGCPIAAGEKVLVYWASANRDEQEFDDPDAFRLDRESNRHLAFGAGPHRCAGSHLARLNLRVALEELTRRLSELRLAVDAGPIHFHSVLNRAPLAVPITFTKRI